MLGKFKIPKGRATGCLPRKFRPGEICPMAADKIKILDDAEIERYVGKVDLRRNVNQILDQDGIGSCATESASQGLMVVRESEGQDFVPLNPWFIYYHTSGGVDRGSSIDENLVFIRDRGIAPESVWSRTKGWRDKPSEEAYAAAKKFRIDEFYDATTIQEVKTGLATGFPVVFGWSIGRNGHSCVLTSLKSLVVAEYANSWKATWGDKGFGQIRLASIDFRYGCYMIRTATDSGGTL